MHPNFILPSAPSWSAVSTHPILPVRTSPVWIPIRIFNSGQFRFFISELRGPNACCCAANAAMHALIAWSSTLFGVFQKHSKPSPTTSPTTPSKDSMVRVITVRYRVSNNRSCLCCSSSAIVAKFAISENIMVTTFLSTWSFAARCLFCRSPLTSCCTTASGTNFAKFSMLCDKRQKPSRRTLISRTCPPTPSCNFLYSSEFREKSKFSRRFMSTPRRDSGPKTKTLVTKAMRRAMTVANTIITMQTALVAPNVALVSC
mmetsp:Transcript_121500/g.190618  ORF Transcript_121500/g.190618 Transcript_121500/m.190618 type:complete len:259 (-) Transcript_121500:1846-2622(-)